MYWGIVCPLYGISLFLPTIINELGYVAATAQLLTIPIYITAAILTIVVAYFSDKKSSKVGRAVFVFVPMCSILIGFIIALAGSAHGHVPGLVYAGIFIATCGIYPAFPGNITWMSNNLAGSYKRSAGMAIHIGAGNLAGAMASNFYRAQDKPKYILGHSLEIGFVSVGLVAVVVLRMGYARVNKKRERVGDEGLSLVQMSEMGDRAPTFRYMY
jgi:MFS family permease